MQDGDLRYIDLATGKTFNSLFEMLQIATRDRNAYELLSTFNSLFEMLDAVYADVALTNRYVLSILYLRCVAVKGQVGGPGAGRPFNSLFEMRWANGVPTQPIASTFNSLFEMPNLGKLARVAKYGFQFSI